MKHYFYCFVINLVFISVFIVYVDAGSGLTLTGYYAIKISFLDNVELISSLLSTWDLRIFPAKNWLQALLNRLI